MAETLTPRQQEAVEFLGDTGIIAAPGSGKTRVLVEKLAWLVARQKIPLNRFLIVTFSEKAAGELRARIVERLRLSPKESSLLSAGTIHATLARFLRDGGKAAGIDPDFKILEEPIADLQKLKLVQEILTRELREEAKDAVSCVRHFGYHRSIRLASELLSKRIDKEHPTSSLVSNLQTAYRQKKKDRSHLDFDDLETCGLALLHRKEFQEKFQKRFLWIFVDEFQDTSPIQWEILRQLHRPGGNRLVIVGDPRQSIYRFRGARPALFWEAIRRIEESSGRTFHLDENFRSTPAIIDFVNRLSPTLFPDFPRPMIARRDALISGTVRLVPLRQETLGRQRTREAASIAAVLKGFHEEGIKWNEIALLFRTRRAMPLFEKAFRDEGIPFQSAGGEPLLESPEVIGILFLWKRLLRPEDALADLALSYSPLKDLSFTAPQNEPLEEWLPKFFEKIPASKNGEAFCDLILKLLKAEPSGSLGDLLTTLEILKTEAARIPCPAPDPDKPGVRLLTVHGAKGLEFPVVILCDLAGRHSTARPPYLEHPELGIIFQEKDTEAAGLKNRLKKTDLYEDLEERERREEDEESKRLLYVALTRAKDRLVLPLVESKKSKGNSKTWNERLIEGRWGPGTL